MLHRRQGRSRVLFLLLSTLPVACGFPEHAFDDEQYEALGTPGAAGADGEGQGGQAGKGGGGAAGKGGAGAAGKGGSTQGGAGEAGRGAAAGEAGQGNAGGEAGASGAGGDAGAGGEGGEGGQGGQSSGGQSGQAGQGGKGGQAGQGGQAGKGGQGGQGVAGQSGQAGAAGAAGGALCGNGKLEAGEDCDGADLGANKTCADLDLGTANELLGCTDKCQYDFDACGGCGDGKITAPEECEPVSGKNGEMLGGATCVSLGFAGGALACSPGCKLDKTACFRCGDGVKNGVEECDGAQLGGLTCGDFKGTDGKPFEAGQLSCSQACLFVTSGCQRCGDTVASGTEVCDGADLRGKSCQTEGFSGGALTCKGTCDGFDTSACTACGNGTIEAGEECDGVDFNGETCVTKGFPVGALACVGCKISTANCSFKTCGDGVLNGPDACDCGNDGDCTVAELDNKSCADFPSPTGVAYNGGTLGCFSATTCAFDTSKCTYCGNGAADLSEQCEGNELKGATCQSRGFFGGTLKCTAGCTIDDGGCFQESCPDGVISGGETCDCGSDGVCTPAELGGKTCGSLGFLSGTLACSGKCALDTSGCFNQVCGDGIVSGNEQCDCGGDGVCTGDELAGKTCASQGFLDGTLGCSAGCTFVTTGCYNQKCGDGIVSGSELCDCGVDGACTPTELGGETCASRGFLDGALGCSATCTFNTASCYNQKCGDGIISGSESCDCGADGQCSAADLGNQTCVSKGYLGGALSCTAQCGFDTSACTQQSCGDGVVSGNEACDCGGDGQCTLVELSGKACTDLTSPVGTPYTGGTLSCSGCSYVTTGCQYCGDGNIGNGETCDGANLGSSDCSSLGFTAGTLSCSACAFDTTGCYREETLCTTPNLSIPDGSGSVNSLISIAGTGAIKDVNVRVEINHTWVGDLVAVVEHEGVAATLLDRPGNPDTSLGCANNDVAADFDDAATLQAETQCASTIPAIGGSVKPSKPLSAFNGVTATGSYKLTVSDKSLFDSGTLVKWCVTVRY